MTSATPRCGQIAVYVGFDRASNVFHACEAHGPNGCPCGSQRNVGARTKWRDADPARGARACGRALCACEHPNGVGPYAATRRE